MNRQLVSLPAGASEPGLAIVPAPKNGDDLDLDRLVWDPEYRDEARELLKPGG